MFLYLSVILFTGGSATHTPPGQTAPGRHPLGRHPHPGQTPLGRLPPWEDTLPQADTPLWADTPGQTPPPVQCMLRYSQQAGGTHPTGMQSCLTYDCIRQVKEIRFHLSTLL